MPSKKEEPIIDEVEDQQEQEQTLFIEPTKQILTGADVNDIIAGRMQATDEQIWQTILTNPTSQSALKLRGWVELRQFDLMAEMVDLLREIAGVKGK
jgi:hypothetical protein